MQKPNTTRQTNRRQVKRIEIMKPFKLIKNIFPVLLLVTISSLSSAACAAAISPETTENSPTAREQISIENNNVVTDVSNEDKIIIKQAVKEFHKLFDRQKFDEIYDQLLDENIKTMRTREDFTGLLANIYAQHGTVKQAKVVTVTAVEQQDSTAIEIRYKTEYQNNKIIQEKFKWIITGGTAKLSSYSQVEHLPLPRKKRNN